MKVLVTGAAGFKPPYFVLAAGAATLRPGVPNGIEVRA